MSEFPRTQKIAALVLITSVVIITLVVVALNGGGSSEARGPVVDPDATPTAVPILQKPRLQWTSIVSEVRGVQGTAPPVACPFLDERSRDPNSFLSLTPALTFVCDQSGVEATPIAPGRVVMRVDQASLNSFKADLLADGQDGPWIRAAAYGPFVAIDHGPLNEVSNVTTIYAGFDAISPHVRVGQLVDTTTPLGSLGARMVGADLASGVLTFELLTDDTRFGGDPLRKAPRPAGDSPALAQMVAEVFSLPVTTCNLPFGNPNLVVGAPREYRSGVHNGLDFNCGTTDHVVNAAGLGQVLFVVDDYVDASVEDRDAVLTQAEAAIDTPFWSLAMLYGNFVVVDHRLDSGERAITIYAHLSAVDPNIVPGVEVDATTPIGFVGNAGTSAAAAGVTNNDGSVHLHWELHVDDRPIGYLESPQATEPLYQQILCDPTIDVLGCG